MKRESVIVWIGVAFCAILIAGRWLLQRMDHDARELRLCRTAQLLSAQYASFREHAEQLPDGAIVKKLMDAELLLPRAAAHAGLVDALKREAPERFPPHAGFAQPSPGLDSTQIAQQMRAWQGELLERYRCPKLVIAEAYVVEFVSTRPRAHPPAPPLEETFGAALERSARTAAMYRESAHADSSVLCRARDHLAKAREIHDYLQQRCSTASPPRTATLNCDAPVRRSQQQLDELQDVVRLNETKFSEKWGPWLDTTAVQCAPGR